MHLDTEPAVRVCLGSATTSATGMISRVPMMPEIGKVSPARSQELHGLEWTSDEILKLASDASLAQRGGSSPAPGGG